MIFKVMNTDLGDILFDGIEQIIRAGETTDGGETVDMRSQSEIITVKSMSEVQQGEIIYYNSRKNSGEMYVFNLIIRSKYDERKEYQTILFKGPAFLMNDAGHTMECFKRLD